MFNYSINGITVASVCDNRRGNKDNEFPIKIRVTHKRIRKYYPTGKYLAMDDWNKLPTSKSSRQIAIKTDIQITFDKVKDGVVILEGDEGFSFEALSKLLGKGVSSTLNAVFEAKIKQLEEEDAIGSVNCYQAALSSFVRFEGKNIPFDVVTIDWLKKYEKQMLAEGKSYTTISMYTRCLRAVVNNAIEAGYVKSVLYPFGRNKYEIPISEKRKMALSFQQIKAVVNYTDGDPKTEKYRDLWFFSYLCNGMNFADLLRLKYTNIKNGEITFVRAKTARTSRIKKEIQAIITPEVQKIIDRWGNPDRSPNSYIFPYLKGNETARETKDMITNVIHLTNKQLKIIGKALGIDQLTTYAARHSYATVLKRSGANIAFISESLGHHDLKTTENYLASFEKEERMKNAALLTVGFSD